ncbi:hypothetical protein QUF99_11365 [Bacillus sp. DX4.1]|uniref:hypothetical protein n=1 Tax=Bacillus sp. DX4.1 TaxID=3055867 RepID=UPI0025A201CD|nr:hypothetical protein [Bacillus sp. DX4.1]MDM5187905.1 hypothetical protein [Bacillus sp. DX4.1]
MLRKTVWFIGALFLGIVAFLYVYEQKNKNSERIVNEEKILCVAMEEPLLAFEGRRDIKAVYVKQAKAFYFLSLFSYENQGRVEVRERILEHVRSLISGGKEPNANGGLDGRTHNIVAQALVLVKHNEMIWEELNREEREKVDWIMRSLAIASHWSYDDDNNFYTGLDQRGNFKKSYNPNYKNGYGNTIVAVTMYFGVKRTKAIFSEFSYHYYMEQFKKYQYKNIINTWSQAGSHIMEQGGRDRKGGYGAGVKNSFIFEGTEIDNVMGIFRKVTFDTYNKNVKNSGADGKAYIVKGRSPSEGEMGMIAEFDSNDAKGKRSDAFYSYESWMNTIPTMLNLKLFNYWEDKDGEIEKRIDVGTKDLLYKLEKGYKGFANGESYVITESDVNKEGFLYDQFIWKYWM